MNKAQFRHLAVNKLKEYGLWQKGWRFQWDRAKRRAGCCKHSKKLITVSYNLFDAMPISENIDTLLHEIAHALAGSGHGHNRVWQQWAMKVGAKPERCYNSKLVDKSKIDYKYTAICPNGHKRYFNRLGRQWKNGKTCGTCRPGVYDIRFKFDIYENY